MGRVFLNFISCYFFRVGHIEVLKSVLRITNNNIL